MRAIGRALFLDLDGTLIVTKSGATFPRDKDDWKIQKGIMECISRYVSNDYFVMIVSNQGGIEAGFVKLNDFRQKIHKIYNEIIGQTGCPFSRVGYRFAMSNNSNDFYRKPNPGMAYDLAISYILDLSQSVMIGDASGKVKRTVDVYEDESSPSNWSYRNGQFVADVDTVNIDVIPQVGHASGKIGTLKFRDFADSDLKFAKASGMTYFDVEDFINLIPHENGRYSN